MRQRRPQNVRRCLTAALIAAAATCVQAQPTTRPIDLDPSRLIADQIASASRQLTDAGSDQDARDNAARRLLSIGTSEARSAVQSALRDPASNAGRLAAARAIADDRPPDPAFVDALFVLMTADSPRPVLEAAAVALGNYKTETDVATRLVALTAAGRPDTVRVAAIRAMSTQIEKRAAQRLVELTVDPSPAVATAAGDGLQTFASLPLSAPADWANWWRTQAEQSDDRFRLEMLTARATRFEQAARHGEETFQELRRKVLAELQAAPREQKGDVLLRYLSSPRESVRLIAIRQAYDYAQTADLPTNCRPAIRTLLSDASDDVRFEAARTMQALNDPDAFAPIAQQLAVEPDTRVRAELARAMGPIGNLEAVPLLRWLLDDSSTVVVQSAAGALTRLGPSIHAADPSGAADLATRLQAMLQSRGASAAVNPRLRETLVEALVPLKQRSLRRAFSTMLVDAGESESVRRFAAMGLGAIGDAETGNVLVDAMTDTAAPVRIESVRSLGKVSDSFFYAEAVYRALDPKNEADAAVRSTAWEVLSALFRLAPREQLANWWDRDHIRNDNARKLIIFNILAEKAGAAAAAGNAGAFDDQTYYLQQVGDTQMALARSLPEPARYVEATAAYQAALTITKQSGGPAMRVDALTEWTLRSLLQGRDYPGAVKFATGLMRDDAYRGIVGREFRLEAERLQTDNKLDDALRLITEVLAMTPALPATYQDQLREVKLVVERRQQEKNFFAFPELDRVYAMR